MNRKAAIPLVAGLVIGLFAVKLVMDFVKKAQGSQQGQQKISIVQAKQDIKAYEKITPEMIQMIETSDSVLAPPTERISDTKELLEKPRVAAKSIPQNSPILKSMLAPPGTPEGIEGRIPPGYRAVAVKIDESTSAGYNLQPGDWVDVIVVMDVDSGVRGKKDTLAEVILQRVQIAAIGQGTNEQSEAAGSKVKPAKSATLIVKQDDAPKLHLAGTRGKITLVLRGSDDTSQTSTALAFGNDFMSGSDDFATPPPPPPATTTQPAPVVEPARPNPHTVLVFRGMATAGKPAPTERITFESKTSPTIIDVGMGAPTGSGSIMRGSRRPANSAPAPAPPAVHQPAGNVPKEQGTKTDEVDDEEYDAEGE